MVSHVPFLIVTFNPCDLAFLAIICAASLMSTLVFIVRAMRASFSVVDIWKAIFFIMMFRGYSLVTSRMLYGLWRQ